MAVNNAVLQKLQTVQQVFNNSSLQKNGVGQALVSVINSNKQVYDQFYKEKGLSVFLKDYLAGKLPQNNAQQPNEKNINSIVLDCIKNMSGTDLMSLIG